MNAELRESLMFHPLVSIFGWTLVHFIWQAALLGVVLSASLRLMKPSTANARYLLACTGLLLMAAIPLGTFAVLVSMNEREVWQSSASIAPDESSAFDRPRPGFESMDAALNRGNAGEWNLISVIPEGFSERPAAEAADTQSGVWRDWLKAMNSLPAATQRHLPLVVVIWFAGVVFLSVRLLAGLLVVRGWRRAGIEVADRDLTGIVSNISSRLGISRKVQLLETARGSVPAVIGWIRPAILIPASMISGMTRSELESILAHELAHVRRHDYLVNLLQTIVETLLFYHPAVWWLSSRIRTERENCCDDEAVAICGNPVIFARALARLEEIRCRNHQMMLAANGGILLHRIRRIVAPRQLASGPCWTAGVVVPGLAGLVTCGLWITVVLAGTTTPDSGAGLLKARNKSLEGVVKQDEYSTRKSETAKVDSRTGKEMRVIAGISLQLGEAGDRRQVSVDMVYSNLFMYTFIPANKAEQLKAKEIGSIDFGAVPPSTPKVFQSMVDPDAEKTARTALEKAGQGTVKVHELTEAVTDGRRIVPYENDAVWVPGHLEFYGMNQTKQHVFKVVRIEWVELGVGPGFGPINALVLDDSNSDFGVLGKDWVRKVAGEKGEMLWFDATGTFHFVAMKHREPGGSERENLAVQNLSESGGFAVKLSGHDETLPRLDRDRVRLLASQTYSHDKRSSSGWIDVNGVKVPVDHGVEFGGFTVYMTLMFDIVTVDSETKKTVWNIDWRKSMPMWNTVSIVELERGGETRLAVELYAANSDSRELVYEYYGLENGQRLEPPETSVAPESETRPQNRKAPLAPDVQVIEKEEGRIKRAVVHALEQKRSATELVRWFSAVEGDVSRFHRSDSFTNMETIVSAIDSGYLIGNSAEAGEVHFNLPKGSGLRAEFRGDSLQITPARSSANVLITNGRIELIDAGGVIRAWAEPDGGAEQLIVSCKVESGEVVMVMKAKRIQPVAGYPSPPVQVLMNTETGSPLEEKDPPHRGIRYEVQQVAEGDKQLVCMKMKWYYDLKRLADEATGESGMTLEQLLIKKD